MWFLIAAVIVLLVISFCGEMLAGLFAQSLSRAAEKLKQQGRPKLAIVLAVALPALAVIVAVALILYNGLRES